MEQTQTLLTQYPEFSPSLNDPAMAGSKVPMVVADADPSTAQLLQQAISYQCLPARIFHASTADETLSRILLGCASILLLDVSLPGPPPAELLEKMHLLNPELHIIVTGSVSEVEAVIGCIQRGAADYVKKPLNPDQFCRKLNDWLRRRSLERSSDLGDPRALELMRTEGLLGTSLPMIGLFRKVDRVSSHFSNVLLRGETGTGKELVARLLHRLSPAPKAPFVVCNCAAITESLFESELFGCVRGAYTGAVRDHSGYIEHASGGTLFLDEIGEVPLSAQAKLLRFLQSREVQRLGSPAVRKVDVRVIAATNRDLKKLVAEGGFREDLYYRLSMVEIATPPLRDRTKDIRLLARHFLAKACDRQSRERIGLTQRALNLLERYDWPGNVRELENLMEYCAMMSNRDSLDVGDLPESMKSHHFTRTESDRTDAIMPLEDMKRKYAKHVLHQVGGNRVRAASLLKIGRVTLYRMLRDESTNGSTLWKGEHYGAATSAGSFSVPKR